MGQDTGLVDEFNGVFYGGNGKYAVDVRFMVRADRFGECVSDSLNWQSCEFALKC